MKIFLPDVNVWIALAFEGHPHHPAASKWFQQYPQSHMGFCRTTQQGFLRIATNAKAVEADALSLPQAWQTYDWILRDPRIRFLEEPLNIEAHWRTFTDNKAYSANIWTDAYLAAFACAADLHFVTFDRGFARYVGLTSTCLEA